MIIQILDEYKNRTEYRQLRDFYETQTITIDALQTGILVLPGILLSKMNKQQLNKLNTWLEDSRNQLILTPAWIDMNLKDVFHSSVDIKISKTDGSFNQVSVEYEIKTYIKEIIYQQDGKCYGINYRKNTGTGLITVVTLPLLDYKFIQFEDKLKTLFDSLLLDKNIKTEFKIKEKAFVLDNIHIFLIILSGAQIDLTQQISAKLSRYFRIEIDEETANQKYKDLIINEYINDCGLMKRGMAVVKERKLKAFINAIKQRGEKEDEWV